MAAAGVSGAETGVVVQASFLDWLGAACRPGGDEDEPATVLIWRDGQGHPVHAVVTLGDGWVLEEASQEWWTPRAVRTVGDTKRAGRAPGRRLERHHIAGSTCRE